MERSEPSCTVGGNALWYIHYGEQYGGFLQKLKIELSYDPAILLLGIYTEKNMAGKYMHPNIYGVHIYAPQDFFPVHCNIVYNSQDNYRNNLNVP